MCAKPANPYFSKMVGYDQILSSSQSECRPMPSSGVFSSIQNNFTSLMNHYPMWKNSASASSLIFDRDAERQVLQDNEMHVHLSRKI